jgi:hypothetical protein
MSSLLRVTVRSPRKGTCQPNEGQSVGQELLDATFMTGDHSLHRAEDDGEYSVMVAAGPYSIPSGGRVRVAFAIVHGTELADGSEIYLAVYDLAGRKIHALAHRRFDAGQHSVVWNGRDDAGRTVASGTYLYRI